MARKKTKKAKKAKPVPPEVMWGPVADASVALRRQVEPELLGEVRRRIEGEVAAAVGPIADAVREAVDEPTKRRRPT